MKYDDIINIDYPFVSKHPSMSLNDRAKIFLPFAALKGYDQLILDKQKVKVQKIELDQDALEELDEKIHLLENNLPLDVSITYYDYDKYETIKGRCTKIDLEKNEIKIDEKIIPLQTIFDILII